MRKEGVKPPVASLESLIPHIDMRGLVEAKPGLLISEDRSSQWETNPIASPVAQIFWWMFKDDAEDAALLRSDLRKFLEGQVVVDLGAGYEGTYGYAIAAMSGASGYVGVEPFHYEHFHGHFEYESLPVPYVVVAEDMRSFVPRLPNNSVSFLISGIDECILYRVSNEDYESLNVGVTRSLDPKGALVANSSIVHGKKLTDYPLKHTLAHGGVGGGLRILTKNR